MDQIKRIKTDRNCGGRLLSTNSSNEMDDAIKNSGLECRFVNPVDIQRKRSSNKLTNSSQIIREMRDEMNECTS